MADRDGRLAAMAFPVLVLTVAVAMILSAIA